MKDEADGERLQQVAAAEALRAKRQLTGAAPCEPGLVAAARGFERDVRARVSGADQEDSATRLQLRDVAVLTRMQLGDVVGKRRGELRDPGPLIFPHRNH